MSQPRNCPGCARRIPYAAQRCIGCGADPADTALRRRRRVVARRSLAASLVSLAVVAVLAIAYSDRYVPAVADWYTRMVIRFLPEPALHFAATDDAQRAFYVCARSVVKQMEDESVATFAGAEGTTSASLGGDRVMIRSSMEEAVEDGAVYRRDFTCTVRRIGARWVIEDLDLDPPAVLVASRGTD